jgi:hypothetical protein
MPTEDDLLLWLEWTKEHIQRHILHGETQEAAAHQKQLERFEKELADGSAKR